jgi:patatin-like phospholipase/acyl hydrolase
MKILCLDGGGVFGFAQARIMSEIENIDKFDGFAGTSIGSAIAASLTLGIKIDQHFFDTWMPQIFKNSIWDKLNIFKPKYKDIVLNKVLQDTFKDYKMGDAKKSLSVTSANIVQGRLKVFESTDPKDSTLPMWEVIRSAVAGETYFAPWKDFADGGVFANNPSMVAIASLNRKLGVPIEEIELLSIGTGDRSKSTYFVPGNLFTWGAWLIQSSLTGSASSMHEYFTTCMPLKKYTRIQFPGRPNWKLDDVKAMKIAEKEWEADIVKAIDVVRNF